MKNQPGEDECAQEKEKQKDVMQEIKRERDSKRERRRRGLNELKKLTRHSNVASKIEILDYQARHKTDHCRSTNVIETAAMITTPRTASLLLLASKRAKIAIQ